jgi:vacuolar-type H+-ATPase subunit H
VGAAVLEVLAILWAVVAALVLIGVGWMGWLRPSRARRQRSAAEEVHPPTAAELDAEWIYGSRSERKPRARPQQLVEEARQQAEAILRDADVKAHEIISSAERARSHAEAELARDRARIAEKSKRLSEFLANALEEVERASANGSASPQDLAELEALREELRSAE